MTGRKNLSLRGIKKEKIRKPIAAVLYGPEGVGKSTWAADAEDAIFLCSEKGTEHLFVRRIPGAIETWEDVMDWITGPLLMDPEHGFKTLVIDTVDWIEPMIWKRVCQDYQVKQIEDIQWAGGYKAALAKWRIFLGALDKLRDRGIAIVMLAHAKVVGKDDPRFDRKVDRWTLNIHNKDSANACALIRQWADCLLFATFDERARGSNKWDRKGAGSGRRIVYTERSVAYDAKNRYGLPKEMSLCWADFHKAAWDNGQTSGPKLAKEIARFREMIAAMTDQEEAEAAERFAASALADGAVDRGTLAQALDRAEFVLAHQEDEQEGEQEAGEGDQGSDPTPRSEEVDPPPSESVSGGEPSKTQESDPSPGITSTGQSPSQSNTTAASQETQTQASTASPDPEPGVEPEDEGVDLDDAASVPAPEQGILEKVQAIILKLPPSVAETANGYVAKAAGDEANLGKLFAWCEKQLARA